MGMLMLLILQLAILCIIGFALVVQGSSGHNISPSPSKFSMFPPTVGSPGAVVQRSDAPSTISQPNGSDLHSPPASPPLMSAPVPETNKGQARSLSPSNSMESPPPPSAAPPPFTIEDTVPSFAPSTPVVLPPFDTAPPPLLSQVHTPSPTAPQKKEPVSKSPLSAPNAPGPLASPSGGLPQNSPAIHPFPSIIPSQSSPENSPAVRTTPVAPPLRNPPQNSPAINSSRPSAFPPVANQRNSSNNKPPVLEPTAPAPVAPQLRNSPQNPPAIHSNRPTTLAPKPSANQGNSANNREPIMEPTTPAPVAPKLRNSPQNPPDVHSSRPSALAPTTRADQGNSSNNRAPIMEPTAPAPVAPKLRNSPQNPPDVHSSRPSALAPTTRADQGNSSNNRAPIMEPTASAPVAPKLRNSPQNPPDVHSSRPSALAPTTRADQGNSSNNRAPIMEPTAPAPVAPKLRNSPQNPPDVHSSRPSTLAPTTRADHGNSSNNRAPIREPTAPAPVAPKLRNSPQNPPDVHSSRPSALAPTTRADQGNSSNNRAPIMEPTAPAPVAPKLRNSPQNPPDVHSSRPSALAPTTRADQGNSSNNRAPIMEPTAPAPVAPKLRNSPQNPPDVHSSRPSALAPTTRADQGNSSNNRAPIMEPTAPATVAPKLRNSPQNPPDVHSSRPSALAPTTRADHGNSSNNRAPIMEPTALAPVAPKLRNSPQNPPDVHFSRPRALAPTPSADQGNSSNNRAPLMEPIAPASVAKPWRNSPQNRTAIHSQGPTALPPSAPILEHTAPVASSPRKLERNPPPVHSIMPPSISPVPIVSPLGKPPHSSPTIHPNAPAGTPSKLPDLDISPVSTPPPSANWNKDGIPIASPTNEIHKPVPPVNHMPENGSSPAISPASTAMRHPHNSPVPSLAPSNEGYHSPALSPSISFHKHQHTRNEKTSPAPASSYLISPPPLKQQGPVISPAFPPQRKQIHYTPAPLHSVSPSHSAVPSSASTVSPVPSPSPMTASRQTMPLISPKVSPLVSPLRSPKVPPPPPVMSFPPPPPNEDCSATICTEPYTNTPPGSPCDCILPMQVGLSLSVALYTFFPLVGELAEEIATGVFMKQSQVRIMGANAASEQPEKTVVLIDLVPLGEKFDHTTALLTYQRFWHKQVAIKTSLFGDYEVLYVHYSGLPPSPPLPPSDVGIIDSIPYSGNDNNARTIKPLGVDVHGKRHKYLLSGGVIAIIVLFTLVAVVLCSAIAWVLLFKRRDHTSQQAATPRHPLTSLAKPSGSAGSMVGSGLSSTSLSFGSSIVGYTGSARTFSASEIEKATDNFDDSRILGEGGFGRVYSGVLEDGTEVAVKVLKRDDQQGSREFLAEVEMLSRLHHRNLVKLIGICTEEHRCLVYELIPNGSVESHLHGVDRESAPLDWDARMKIALGAARGLAYLHEDSSPRVIHRDFKSSNILLEHDFTPKVSDFGLARTAMDEEGRHISTRVMGTFGYVAPEYAMTGHLLVKSDVYSYGVVLLELLTGRKPVDMTQPPGQENLVAWARPLLGSEEWLETIIDPSLGSDVPFDSVAKVSAIASMCVQPEVSHRPFMGEVVQALKLVCNECDEAKEVGSRSSSQDDFSIDIGARVGTGSVQLTDPVQSHLSLPHYDSGLDTERGLSVSDLFSSSARIGRQSPQSFRRHCSSGPLRTGRGSRFWQKMQRLSRGSISEHGVMIRFWPGSH